MCSGAVSASVASNPTMARAVMKRYGGDGTKGSQPSFAAYLATQQGRTELQAFAQRVKARYWAFLRLQPAHLRSGARLFPLLQHMGNSLCAVASGWLRADLCLLLSTADPSSQRDQPSAAATKGQVKQVDDANAKVEFVLEHGLRDDRRRAEKFVAAYRMDTLSVADFRQRAELLRMFGRPLKGVPVVWWSAGLSTTMVPRLAFVAKHACASVLHASLSLCWRDQPCAVRRRVTGIWRHTPGGGRL